jgi:hypothetical protein
MDCAVIRCQHREDRIHTQHNSHAWFGGASFMPGLRIAPACYHRRRRIVSGHTKISFQPRSWMGNVRATGPIFNLQTLNFPNLIKEFDIRRPTEAPSTTQSIGTQVITWRDCSTFLLRARLDSLGRQRHSTKPIGARGSSGSVRISEALRSQMFKECSSVFDNEIRTYLRRCIQYPLAAIFRQ